MNKGKILIIALVFIFTGSLMAANILVNPGLEDQKPAFWSAYNTTIGEGVSVSSDYANNGFYSFKVTKSSSSSEAMGWVSDNNADLYWNNAGTGSYELSGYVKTVGVNTDPANDDEKIGIVFEFKNDAGDVLTTQNVWVDQSSADMDWTQVTGVVANIAEEPASVVIKLQMGKDATGTVYFDDIGCNTTDSWTMWPFNAGGETVEGWMNWYDANNGSYGIVEDNAAHTGSYSVELFKPDTTSSSSEIVYYSTPAPVEAGEWYKIGVWVKTEGVNDSSTFESTYIKKERLDERLGLCYFFHADDDIEKGWTTLGGDKFVYVNQTESTTDWTHYEVAERAPEGATGISVRARFTSNPTGTAYFDDFSVEKIEATGEQLLANPGLENQKPAFWNAYNTTIGDGINVSSDYSNNGFYSFMVEKSSSSSESIGWISDNNADLYWNNAGTGSYELSGYVKTVGVNTDPANDDEKIGIVYEFKNSTGDVLTTQNVWVDQSSADMDWTQVTGVVANIAEEPATVTVKLQMGKDATGTVYFDDIGCNTTDSWTMWPFNAGAETVDEWMNWYDANNGSYGIVEDNAAHTGSYSAELFKPDTTNSSSEIVYYSTPAPVEAGEWYKVGVWVKTEGVNDSSTFEPTYITKERLDKRLGLCYFFHADDDIEKGWTTLGGDKFVYVDQTESSKDWTLYEVAEKAPEGATGISVRARFTSHPTGTAYFDDFGVHKMVTSPVSVEQPQEIAAKPNQFELKQNYPNPFNPTTNISFIMPAQQKVKLTIYNILGQQVKTLVDGRMNKGPHTVTWNAVDQQGNAVPSGMYIYVLSNGNTRMSRKMVLLR
ncbi:MAG: T9SS type A sorting domain-containing protein [Candidatus Marinimicrobia bacterium]|nr:T9SS type A sorting domain-containing protein [Candidatus Neomarinimicrobiota bacterium]